MKHLTDILAIIAFGLAIFGLTHHYIITDGIWWEWRDICHHEPLIAICIVAGVGLLVGKYVRKA